jgi:nucleoside phosphorylase
VRKCLNTAALNTIGERLSQTELFEMWSTVSNYLHWSIGDPTEQTIISIRHSAPHLGDLIDFAKICARLEKLPEFERSPFGVSLAKFFPEIVDVRNKLVEVIAAIPQSVEKANSWIRIVALDAGADSDVEAAIYLASRGDVAAVDSEMLRERWHAMICNDIASSRYPGIVPEPTIERAKQRTISLAEASQVLRFGETLNRFFSFRDEEEIHIDSTMFRAVDWLGISGFTPWLESAIEDLSKGPQAGVDQSYSAWWLYHWCRSDLAIRMADQAGLESWLWALLNGGATRQEPWRIFWADRKGPRDREYLPLAAIILFAWHRINPSGFTYDVPVKAIRLLEQTQLQSGAWPAYSDDSEPDLLATMAAVHGLASAQSTGWRAMVARAADWLLTQQQDVGYWAVQGGPIVAITIEALDAISIGRGETKLTFSLTTESSVHLQSQVEKHIDLVFDFSKVDWHNPPATESKSTAIEEAKQSVKPRLALLVATETELKQVLRLLRPLPRQKKIWKVSNGHETTYLGRFGTFETAVVMCFMGTLGVSGATLTANAVIEMWNPDAVVFVGIAFGAKQSKHQPGDVLVASQLIPYESQRVGSEIIFRNPVPPAGGRLLNRFRNTLEWSFYRPDDIKCNMHVGPVLTGEKLVDNLEFKDKLLAAYPSALGGEMEGAGLWAAAERHRKEWIVVKAVCDWGDGHKNDAYQELAAASAASLCHHVFDDQHALDGF